MAKTLKQIRRKLDQELTMIRKELEIESQKDCGFYIGYKEGIEKAIEFLKP